MNKEKSDSTEKSDFIEEFVSKENCSTMRRFSPLVFLRKRQTEIELDYGKKVRVFD